MVPHQKIPRMQRLDRTRPEPVKDNGLGLNPLDAAYPLEFAFQLHKKKESDISTKKKESDMAKKKSDQEKRVTEKKKELRQSHNMIVN